jgi:hypothetical protein
VEEVVGQEEGEHVARTASDYEVPVIGHFIIQQQHMSPGWQPFRMSPGLNLTMQLYVAVFEAANIHLRSMEVLSSTERFLYLRKQQFFLSNTNGEFCVIVRALTNLNNIGIK